MLSINQLKKSKKLKILLFNNKKPIRINQSKHKQIMKKNFQDYNKFINKNSNLQK